jgi:hypothetical protein
MNTVHTKSESKIHLSLEKYTQIKIDTMNVISEGKLLLSLNLSKKYTLFQFLGSCTILPKA